RCPSPLPGRTSGGGTTTRSWYTFGCRMARCLAVPSFPRFADGPPNPIARASELDPTAAPSKYSSSVQSHGSTSTKRLSTIHPPILQHPKNHSTHGGDAAPVPLPYPAALPPVHGGDCDEPKAAQS